jgi:DNA polymerase-3 subunit gamma/tau
MARLLSKAVNCLDEDVAQRPCNRCHICQSINQGRLLDLIEMDAASHTGVDNVREAIRDKVGFRPSEARYKVYVIDEVHMLSTSAFNALLKTLEEPPEHVIFCLATTEPHRILPTILSRCQRFDFRRIPLSALVARLRYIADQEGIQVDDLALQFVARTATGSARDAISLLDQLTAYGDEVITVERLRSVLGLSDIELVHQLATHLVAHDIGAGLSVINQAVEQGADMRQFAQQVVDYVRSTLLVRVGGDVDSQEADARTRARWETLAKQCSTHDLLRAIKLFNQAQLDLRSSDQSQLALELAFVEAAMAEDPQAVVTPGPVAAGPPVVEPAFAPAVAATTRTVSSRPPARAPRMTVHPPAPSRSQERVPVQPEEQPQPSESRGESVTLQEIDEHWSEIRHAIRAENHQAEALFNSAMEHWIEDRSRLVLCFASEFLSSKIGEEGNRRLVEKALQEVLGRPCRVRGTVGESAPDRIMAEPAPSGSADGNPSPNLAESTEQAESDLLEEATRDPVVQDLVNKGGQVTDVQMLSQD